MVQYRIPDDKGGVYHVNTIDDFEHVNPLLHEMEHYVNSRIRMMAVVLESQGLEEIIPATRKAREKMAIKGWVERYKEVLAVSIPENLMALLDNKSKKEQIRLLKSLTIDFDELNAFIWKACMDFDFTHSQYKSVRHQNGLDLSKLPRFIYKHANGSVTKAGATSLSDKQLRVVIDTRKVILAKFLDRGEEWLCFYYTFKSIAGQENYGDEQPHIHFISDKWGVPRADIVAGIKSGYYKAPSTTPHINIVKLEWPEESE